MKLVNIFNKNLKIVARNPVYFIILVVCPLLLIVSAGFLLNSINFDKIKLGYIDNQVLENVEEVNFDDKITAFQRYYVEQECISDLESGKINACIKLNDGRNVEIYIDNSHKLMDYFARQYVLDSLMDQQNLLIENKSIEAGSKISLFRGYLSDAENELGNAENELDKQEKMIMEYRKNLSDLKKEFDLYYLPLKKIQNNTNYSSEEIEVKRENLKNNISEFNKRKENIDSQINYLRFFLSSTLSQQQYNIANEYLTSIQTDLNAMNSDLNEINNLINSEEFQILLDFNKIMNDLDRVNDLFYEVDRDLENALELMSNAKEKMRELKEKIKEGKENIDITEESISGVSGLNPIFKNIYEYSDNPVFLAFPLIFTIIITFTSVVLPNMFVLKEVNRPSYLKEIISPTNNLNFIFGTYLVNLFFIFIQIVVLFLLGVYWFGVDVGTSSVLFVGGTLSASIFIMIGMSIGYFVRSNGISTLISLFFVMFFFIFSEVLAPASLASPIVQFIMNINPFFVLYNSLTEIILAGGGFQDNVIYFKTMSYLLGITFIILVISKRISERKTRE